MTDSAARADAAVRPWPRYALLIGTVVLLLIPRTILSSITALFLIVPLTISGVQGRDRMFLYWVAYVVALFIFAYVREIADNVGPGPFAWYPIALDRLLGFGTVPTVILQKGYTPGNPHWWDYAGISIYLTHYMALPLTALIMAVVAPRVLPSFLLCSALVLLIGGLIHVLVPTVPPWIAGQTGLLPTVYRPLVDIVGGFAPGVYAYGQSVAGGNDVAAMPSMHTAAATIVALGARTGPRWLRMLTLAYAVLMPLTLVYFGEHYVVDAIAGAALAIVSWRVVTRWLKAHPG